MMFLKQRRAQSCTQCHSHWPLQRTVACMSSFNPRDFKQTILSESRGLIIVAGYVMWGYVLLLCGLTSEHLQCSFQLAAIHRTDGNKNGTAAFEGLFKILCDFLLFNVDATCSWTNIKMPQSSFASNIKKGQKVTTLSSKCLCCIFSTK